MALIKCNFFNILAGMISLAIIGQGNVAFHLLNAFSKTKNIETKQLNSRKDINTEGIDIAIIAVSDDAIAEVSKKIYDTKTLVVHTSGSASINVLQNKGGKGVFYPLQSFSKDKKIDFNNIPFCLEAESEENIVYLERLASCIGKNTYRINSQQRQSLHISAVFVNNFTNHMYKIANDICKKNDVPFNILKPLILETAKKIDYLSPKESQTGPAIRKDQKTIENHLGLLNKEQQEIYKLITKSIQNG